ncbi:YggS family pyridoxal phosphate-dependent enzyme [Salmonirosea aquatica]|uniref:Pyridoxal phosphate homeostasis protein n=1 Tax=Salmonirosea aquatica TaxID=2654236 RepID=A0A7C9FP54_9BACT|nr:YggS family pyridoxal phosphate-dependent enzyme [Cytophagaceae bacterium SJW1-29]
MRIQKAIGQISQELGSKARLVAVTKTKPIGLLREAYEAGCTMFGENKVQEMVEKHEHLPQDIAWHMIGHLQTNKVKYIAPFVALIHSVDSLKVLKEIDKQAKKNNRIIECLLQVHIAEEESKFGFSEQEVLELLASDELGTLKNVRIVGLMGMATNTDAETQIRKEFRGLRTFFDSLKARENEQVSMRELSMGMSGDYRIAIEEGSTLVRVGSAIFGARH